MTEISAEVLDTPTVLCEPIELTQAVKLVKLLEVEPQL